MSTNSGLSGSGVSDAGLSSAADREPTSAEARVPGPVHELNQPLTALTLYLQAMRMVADRSDIPLPAGISALLDKALAEALRAQDLARQLGAPAPSPDPSPAAD